MEAKSPCDFLRGFSASGKKKAESTSQRLDRLEHFLMRK
jgi:hypothetical protein